MSARETGVKHPVAVFGSSEPLPGEPSYDTAREVGRRLAEAGFDVVTGAYGGVMEAASRGAAEAGGEAIGVACRIFDREPNRFLTEVRWTTDLFDRTRTLVDASDAYVVLDGKAGTLAEVSFLWALQRAGCLADRPVLLCGQRWNELLRELERLSILEEPQMNVTHMAKDAETAVRTLTRVIRRGEERP